MTPIKTTTFILPKLLRYGMVAIIIFGGILYASWQGRFLITGPEIALTNIPETVQNDRVVTISGTAYNATALFLNGRPIVTNSSGDFTEAVVLENGYSVISIDVYDRYGRIVRWERPFVYIKNEPPEDRQQMSKL